jgi:two-component system, NarL family, sensor histidine kinase UhpB
VGIRITQIWNGLSLRARLFLPLGMMFVAALLLGAIALQIFATEQLAEENESAARSAKAVAVALNGALQASAEPRKTLDAFAEGLGKSEAIQFRPAGTFSSPHEPVVIRTPLGRVPQWFIHLLAIPEISDSFPVMLERSHVGDIVFSPDLSAQIFEKWIGFLAIAISGIGLMLVTAIIAYFTAGSALNPLRELSAGLTRMRLGHYHHLIPPSGPPEIRRSCEEANALARTLDALSHDNKSLLRKMVSLQDDERRDIARELHDELGPLLFGIRANTVVTLESIPPSNEGLAASTQNILQSVEALQQANRRILDHLRPLYIQELGLERSIQTLLQNTRSQAPAIELAANIDARLNAIDGLLSQTVYRVIQEGLTNVLRHAKASAVKVEAAIDGDELKIEISDDGVGFPAEAPFGRGLTGMHERVRALSGTFRLLREGERTFVHCRLPLSESAREKSDKA